MITNTFIRRILAAELLLLVPLIAMVFTDEVNWGAEDFLVISVLLVGVGIAYHMTAIGIKNNSRQVVIGLVLAAAILLIWAELAVGIFGSPIAGS